MEKSKNYGGCLADIHTLLHILSAVNSSQPDIVIAGATIGKFSFFNNLHFLVLLDQLNCPIVIAKDFTIPGMHRVKMWLTKIIRK